MLQPFLQKSLPLLQRHLTKALHIRPLLSKTERSTHHKSPQSAPQSYQHYSHQSHRLRQQLIRQYLRHLLPRPGSGIYRRTICRRVGVGDHRTAEVRMGRRCRRGRRVIESRWRRSRECIWFVGWVRSEGDEGGGPV
ncbi:hypothetical protein LINPERPRIM_LOCUS16947 [Linum perenne]